MAEPKHQIRALHTDSTVTVYQAYAPEIGLPAAREGRFPVAWQRDRMTFNPPRPVCAGARWSTVERLSLVMTWGRPLWWRAADVGRIRVATASLECVRTIELDALAGVRRFAAMGRGGAIDELRLRDRHGLRLTIGHDTRAEGFIRRAVERADAQPGGAPVKVTRHARSRLGLEPRSSVPRFVHLFFGLWVMAAAFTLPAVGSYTVACFLAGTSAWASTPGH